MFIHTFLVNTLLKFPNCLRHMFANVPHPEILTAKLNLQGLKHFFMLWECRASSMPGSWGEDSYGTHLIHSYTDTRIKDVSRYNKGVSSSVGKKCIWSSDPVKYDHPQCIHTLADSAENVNKALTAVSAITQTQGRPFFAKLPNAWWRLQWLGP